MRTVKILGALILLAWGGTAARAAELVLARVNGSPITLADLKAAFERRHEGHISLLADETVVRDFLDAMVRQRLFVQEARRLGLHEREAFLRFREQERDRIAMRWLYESEVQNRVRVPPEAVARAVEAMARGWEVIRIQTDTLEDAEAARSRILAGEDASEVAREVSTARSSLRGGLELIRWGQEPPPVEALLQAAKEGDLTAPVEGPDGWVVFLVRSRPAVPVARDAEARAREILRRREVERLRDAFLDSLRRRYEARIHDERLDLALLDRCLAGEAPEEDPVLAEWSNGRMRHCDLAARLDRRAYEALRPGLRRLRLRQLLSDQLDQALLRLEAARRWGEAPPYARAALRAAEEEYLYAALLREVVFAGLEVTEGEIRSWYDAHREELRRPPQVLLSVALLPDEASAQAFLEALGQGARFADLARERSLDRETALRGGRTVWVSREDLREEFPEEVLTLAPGSVGGPVRLEEGWLVYRVEDRREASIPSLDEAADEIRSRVLEEKQAERLRIWEAKLRESGEVAYHSRRIRRAVKIMDSPLRKPAGTPPAMDGGDGGRAP